MSVFEHAICMLKLYYRAGSRSTDDRDYGWMLTMWVVNTFHSVHDRFVYRMFLLLEFDLLTVLD